MPASRDEVVMRGDAADENREPRTDLPCAPAAAVLYRAWYLAPRTEILGWVPPFTNTVFVPFGVFPGGQGYEGRMSLRQERANFSTQIME